MPTPGTTPETVTTPHLTTQQRREIGAAAAAHDRTVCKAYNGHRVSDDSWQRIVAAATKLKHPLPKERAAGGHDEILLFCGLTVGQRRQLVAETGIRPETVSRAYSHRPVRYRTGDLLIAAARKLGIPEPDVLYSP